MVYLLGLDRRLDLIRRFEREIGPVICEILILRIRTERLIRLRRRHVTQRTVKIAVQIGRRHPLAMRWSHGWHARLDRWHPGGLKLLFVIVNGLHLGMGFLVHAEIIHLRIEQVPKDLRLGPQ